MKRVAVIPARYASSRFPAKPLAMLKGKPMVMWVYDAVCQSELFDIVIIATDDERIKNCAESYGANVRMTSAEFTCGTQRCEFVLSELEREGVEVELVVNVQGDEPLISKTQLSDLLNLFDAKNCEIATLAKEINDIEELTSANCVKVVKSNNKAIYFSRSVIPHLRGYRINEYLEHHTYYKHIGLYGYKVDVLHEIVKMEPSSLEIAESLEQLRWLENGYTISIGETDFESIGVDTPEDLDRVNKILDKNI